MLQAELAGADGQDSLRRHLNISRDGKTVTTLVYFGDPLWTQKARLDAAKVAVDVALPADSGRSPARW